MELAQIDASSYTTDAQAKNKAGVWEKRNREGQRIPYTYIGLGMGCFTKVRSSLRYDFALKPECEEDPVLFSYSHNQ